MASMTIKGLKVSERQNYHEYSIGRDLAKECTPLPTANSTLMWSKECFKTTTMLSSQNHHPSLISFWLEPCRDAIFMICTKVSNFIFKENKQLDAQ